MKYCYFILFITTATSCYIKDDNTPKPEDAFIRYMGSGVIQRGLDIEPIYATGSQTSLEGLIILGTRENEDDPTIQDFYFIRTNANGVENVTNTATIEEEILRPSADADADSLFTITGNVLGGKIEVLNDGFAFTGSVRFINEQNSIDSTFSYLGRINADLSEISTQIIRRDNALSNDIIQTSDGGFVVAGAISISLSATESEYNFYAAKYSKDFQTEWETDGENGSFVGDDVLVRVFESSSTKNYIFFGYSNRSSGSPPDANVIYLALNPQNGVPVGARAVGVIINGSSESNEILNDVHEINDTYMAVGSAFVTSEERYGFTMPFNPDGSSLDPNAPFSLITYNDQTQTVSEANAVTKAPSNDFIVVGALPNLNQSDAAYFNVDPFGRIIGSQSEILTFGIQTGTDEAVDVLTLPDGKIMVLATIDFGGGISLISLLKLNENGAFVE